MKLLLRICVLFPFAYWTCWAGHEIVQSRNPDHIEFFLYANPLDKNDYDVLSYQNSNSRFNPHNPIILLIHGFSQNYRSAFPVIVRDAYLKAGFSLKSNIIVVNWGKLSRAKDNISPDIVTYYAAVVPNIFIVGKRVQEFIVFLQENKLTTTAGDIHIVGHSLGAHVAGIAGSYYYSATGNFVNRITGSDPASPGFENQGEYKRLDSNDANFVDVIHSNPGQYGYRATVGHVDFYINGGNPIQPECNYLHRNVSDSYCSHNTSPQYYAKSIQIMKAMNYKFNESMSMEILQLFTGLISYTVQRK